MEQALEQGARDGLRTSSRFSFGRAPIADSDANASEREGTAGANQRGVRGGIQKIVPGRPGGDRVRLGAFQRNTSLLQAGARRGWGTCEGGVRDVDGRR